MNEEEIKRLQELRDEFRTARIICDPIDFANPQKNLIYAVVNYLLKPLDDYEREEMEKRKGQDL